MIEIVNESYHKEKIAYYLYTGPVIDSKSGVIADLEDHIIDGAVSMKSARRLLSDEIKEITGRTPRSLPGEFVKVVEDEEFHDYCDDCGSLLDDQGVCHKCNPELDYD